MTTEGILTIGRIAADVSIRVAVLAALAGVLLHLCRVRSSSLRHLVWTTVLGGMVLMPLLPRVMPELPVRLPFAAVRPAPPIASAVVADAPREVRASVARSASGEPVLAQVRIRQPAASPLVVTIEKSASVSWPAVLLATYFAGAAWFLTRFFIGLAGVLRIRRTATRIEGSWPSSLDLRESDQIATPVILGVVWPVVVLPAAWRTWPSATIDGVIAHERAHILRRDPLVSAIARVNRCVFWFHPLAWWLARAIDAAAEEACDAAGVRAMGTSHGYADVLVQMARAVRRHRGRLAWHGVGVSGSGSLSRRIDRVLAGATTDRRTRRQSWLVVTASTVLIAGVAACQGAAAVEPLREDPEITARWAAQKARGDEYTNARSLSVDRVAALEARWAKNPEDLDALGELLRFYGPDISGKRAPNEAEIIAKRRRMILWLIEHHPEHALLGELTGRIFRTPLDWLHDPIGYDQAKKLWLAHVARPGVTAAVLDRAVWFFSVDDKPIAERILLQAIALDPEGKTLPPVPPGIWRDNWKGRLGALYAQAIVGSNSFPLGNVIRSNEPALASGDFAQQARRTLDETKDPALLYNAGRYLVQSASQAKVPFDHQALGRTYVRRALDADPAYEPARRLSARLERADSHNRIYDLLENVPVEKQHATVAALPEADRFTFVAELAGEAYMRGDAADHDSRMGVGSDWRALARRWANDALELAPRLTDHRAYASTLFNARLVLGLLALRDGDRRKAVDYMLQASRGPALGPYDMEASLDGQLTAYLLKYGERATVVEFFERAATMVPSRREALLKNAAAVRDGRMTSYYQTVIARR
jgi:beta-lactamase regulating signal transducer with metallopeptidase domain